MVKLRVSCKNTSTASDCDCWLLPMYLITLNVCRIIADRRYVVHCVNQVSGAQCLALKGNLKYVHDSYLHPRQKLLISTIVGTRCALKWLHTFRHHVLLCAANIFPYPRLSCTRVPNDESRMSIISIFIYYWPSPLYTHHSRAIVHHHISPP